MRALESDLKPNNINITFQIKDSEKQNEIVYSIKNKETGENTTVKQNYVFTTERIKRMFESVSDADAQAIGFSQGMHPKHTLLEVLPVIPPCARPASEQDGKIWPDELTKNYEDVLKAKFALADAKARNLERDVQIRRKQMNTVLQTLMLGPTKSVRDRIQGKEAIPRAHLMSKRVDFSGRTVISPDPSLKFGQVRIPLKICKEITWPERVTTLNLPRLTRALREGRVKRLFSAATQKHLTLTDKLRETLTPEIGDICHRWIQDGDYVIVNRNPTLSRHSFQAMEVVVGRELTIGLPLAYTTPYNADFDGDEMNIHVPQSLEVLAELKSLNSVVACLMTGSSNKNAMGIVFNSVTAAYLLTKDNPPVAEDVYNQAIMKLTHDAQLATLDERLRRQGVEKYSGRGLFSAFLPERFFYRKGEVVVREGVLVSGAITKSDLGPVSRSMVQEIWHQDSAERAAGFITDAVYILDYWLSRRGYSVGISDCYPDDPDLRKQISDQVLEVKAVVESLGPKIGNTVIDELTENRIVDALASTNTLGTNVMKKTNTALIESIRAGTKGSAFNVAQTMATVGQQMIQKSRIEYNKTYFNPDDPSMDVNARGFIESSYMEGLNPAAFVSLMAGGREGLIDTALNTADSGHLHHMIMKTTEDIKVNRRGMVVNSYGVVFQFAYGDDGLNPEFLQRVNTPSGDALSFINLTNEIDRLNAKYGYVTTA
jgi:DNA-directed RNA polymerase II subunit RPB1